MPAVGKRSCHCIRGEALSPESRRILVSPPVSFCWIFVNPSLMTLSLFAFSVKLPQSFLLDAHVPDFMMCYLPAAHIYLLLAILSLPCCVLNKLTRLKPKILL